MKTLLAAAVFVLLAGAAHADEPALSMEGHWCLLTRDGNDVFVRSNGWCFTTGPNDCPAVRLQAVVRKSSPPGFMCVRGCCFWATE